MNTLALVFVLLGISSSLAKPNYINVGFSFSLIHVDSSQSPLHNPNHTRFDRHKNAFRRSTFRASHLSKRAGFTSNVSSDANIPSASGEYLMEIKIGTPPVKVIGIADTGSDLTWAQCKPCVNCYKQGDLPLLVPSNSSTYRALSCQSKGCKALDTNRLPCNSSSKCRYTIGEEDMYSHTTGDVAVDTFWFGSSPVKKVMFGCGHDNQGLFNRGVSGSIGLGGGPVSIINQLHSKIKGKFSYCLIPYSSNNTNLTSKIHFGTHAKVEGPNVVSTPLSKKDQNPSPFYSLTLEGMLVGKKNVLTSQPLLSKEGNIVIDSGATLTYVPREFYDDLTAKITSIIGMGTSDPQGFEYCYKNLNLDRVPSVTFRFKGADVEVSPHNMFMEIEKGVSCLALVSSDDGLAIFGNLSQRNMLVGYDLVNRKVSFKPTDCTKQA